jgi:hypothetical protein
VIFSSFDVTLTFSTSLSFLFGVRLACIFDGMTDFD